MPVAFSIALSWTLLAAGSASGTGPKPTIESAPTLRLGGMTQRDSVLTPRLKAFYAELGRRIGHRIALVDAPIDRIAQDMADGKLDGLAYRTRLIESHPLAQGLRRVPVSVGGARISVYALDASAPCMASWDDLAKAGGRFSQMRGYLEANYYLDSLKLRGRVVAVDSVGQALRLLSAGRTHFAIEIFDIMEARIRAGEAPRDLRFLGTLNVLPVYLYLPRQDTTLYSRSVSALHDMIADSRVPSLLPKSQPLQNPQGCALRDDLVGLP